ncbi:MAG: fumarylacetoacetate hydrolase family protein, partial [Gammaproteobacteria bacterium]|nr:fumarylacetoacetate hydrolase family protein [Gammaproteobacteria bacterium]
MKLLRYGPAGQERPGLLDPSGVIRDLSGHIADITPEQLAPANLARIAALDPLQLAPVAMPQRYGPPVCGTRKFLAIGLNYADHAAESNMPIPDEPIVFSKATSCIQGPDDDVILPRNSVKSDWEVELGVVLGSVARYVDAADALNYVAGYLVVNDLSEREFQLERGGQWDKGKGCDTFGPIGPWLVTADEVGEPQNLDLWLDVNGEPMQRGNTRTMVFTIAQLVSHVSCFMTLEPGDILTTGTPPGVGLGRKPPVFLKAGDTL